MSGFAVFAYGSLVSAASAAETLGREVAAMTPATLTGHRRDWTVARDNQRSEKTFALADGTRPSFCLGLNLTPDPEAPAPNGALIEVTEDELERLDLRELRYRRVEVTAAVAVRAPHGFEAVYAYAARPEHHRPEPPGGAVLIAAYLRAVEAAFAELGAAELERFRATTAPPRAQTVEASLIREAIPPGNPRAW